MTETEKEERRKLKADTASWLGGVDLGAYSYALEGTDPRILEYAHIVIDHPDDHNVWELLALKRFFYLLDKYQWKRGRVRRFLDFYECLKFNGQNGRRSYRLTPIQCFQFANIFGFARPDGLRLIRDAYYFVPRKFSKTTSAASLAVYDLLFGDNNSQAYVGANSYEQAKLCFDEIRNIMRDLDPDETMFRINREKIFFKSGERDSYARCLTANARTQDGLNASLVIMDEYAQARNSKGKNGADLKNVLTSSMGTRKEPLTVIITTASEVIDGPFRHELEGVKKVLLGEVENDTVFATLFEPDVDDAEDDPHTWAKVQPHMGVTVQPDWYEKEWASAQLSAENMVTFRTKLLNVFCINEEKRWFTVEKAHELLNKDFDINKVRGVPTAVTFDLSVHDDFSCVSYTIYNSRNGNYYCHTDYYIPEWTLNHHENRQLYSLWAEQGYLKVCKGEKIDVHMIANDIVAHSRHLPIIVIAYDSYKAQDLVNILATFGRGVLHPYPQTNGSFNLPVESFEMLAYNDPPKVWMNDNPINAYCLENCVLLEDQLGNKKPHKYGSDMGSGTDFGANKIDGTITMLMGLGSLYKYER